MFCSSIEIPEEFIPYITIQDALDGNEYITDEEIANVFHENSTNLEFLEFLAQELAECPRRRHTMVEKVRNFCKMALQTIESRVFKEYLLSQLMKNCPKIARHLFDDGFYQFFEIEEQLNILHHYIPASYFIPFIHIFDRFTKNFTKPNEHTYQLLQLKKDNYSFLNELIQYGWPRKSIGYAIKYDDVEKLKEIYEQPSFKHLPSIDWSTFEWAKDPNTTDFWAITAYFGSLKCFRYLLMNKKCPQGFTTSYAIMGGNLDIIRLCEYPQMVYSQYINVSIKCRMNDVFEWLLQNSNDAIIDPNLCLIQRSLRMFLVSISYPNGINFVSNNKSPLFWAGELFPFMVTYLIRNGAKPIFTEADQIACVSNGFIDNLYYFQENIHGYNIKTANGQTLLHLASQNGHLAVVRFLLRQGCNIDAVDHLLNTPLHVALSVENRLIAGFLLDQGCSINIQNGKIH